MGFCSYANCSRSAKDGSYLPLKNKRYLKAWIKRIGRAQGTFEPTVNSYVCGLHFLESDWEIKNGERKLKIGVIPQPVSFKKEDETATRKRKANPKYSTDELPAPKQAKANLNDELLKEARLEISKREYEISQLKRQNQRLTTMLEKVFNKDQICGIGDKIDLGLEEWRPREWTQKTLIESEQLRNMCGASGYNLLREKFPFPSIRTLQRQTGPSKCNEENQRDILANLPSNAQPLEENDKLE